MDSLVFAGTVAVAVAVIAGVWRAKPVVAVLGGWFAAAVVLGAAGVFEAATDREVPLIALGIAVPLIAGMVALARRPDLTDDLSLRWLIGVQAYRVLGAAFLVAWLDGRMPAAFALPAGLGDVAIGLAAPFVATRSDRARVIWNVLGIVDLVVAVTMGFLTSPSPFQQLALDDPNLAISRFPFVLVPVFAVPLSVLLHLVALRRLTTGAATSATDDYSLRSSISHA